MPPHSNDLIEPLFWVDPGLAPATIAAIERIQAFDRESALMVELSNSSSERSLTVSVRVPGGLEPLLAIGASGTLRLRVGELDANSRAGKAIAALAQNLGSVTPASLAQSSYSDEKTTTFAAGEWEPQLEVITGTLQWIARKTAEPSKADRISEGSPAAYLAPKSQATANETTTPARSVNSAFAPELTDEDIEHCAAQISAPLVREEFTRWARDKQSQFRFRLLQAYDGACCVSNCTVEEVLDAAHIEEHATGGVSSVQNGLLLRTDLHCLFDRGLMAIDPSSLRVSIHHSAMSAYATLHGVTMRCPRDLRLHPDREMLRARWDGLVWVART